MKISIDEVRHVAHLARLSLSEDQLEAMMQNMNSILDYMDLLNEVDTTDIEPASHIMDISNIFRDDEVRPSLPPEVSLNNAPEKNRNSFVVPRVI